MRRISVLKDDRLYVCRLFMFYNTKPCVCQECDLSLWCNFTQWAYMSKLSNIKTICGHLNKRFNIDLRVEWGLIRNENCNVHVLKIREYRENVELCCKSVPIYGNESVREYRDCLIYDMETEIIEKGIIKMMEESKKRKSRLKSFITK